MAQEIAEEQEISPHEALIGLVRTATARAAWVDGVIIEQMRQHVQDGGNPLEPPAAILPWLKQSRQERTLAARTAKAAVDAGVMAALERRLDIEGEHVAAAITAGLDALELDHEQRVAALGAAQQHLLGTAGE